MEIKINFISCLGFSSALSRGLINYVNIGKVLYDHKKCLALHDLSVWRAKCSKHKFPIASFSVIKSYGQLSTEQRVRCNAQHISLERKIYVLQTDLNLGAGGLSEPRPSPRKTLSKSFPANNGKNSVKYGNSIGVLYMKLSDKGSMINIMNIAKSNRERERRKEKERGNITNSFIVGSALYFMPPPSQKNENTFDESRE